MSAIPLELKVSIASLKRRTAQSYLKGEILGKA
jgi:hypothetical protein